MRPEIGTTDSRRGSLLALESSRFVGRTAELEVLDALLRAPERLVSVVGPRGIGKTRLVVRYASSRIEKWPGGVWYCDLRHATSAGAMAAQVFAALAGEGGETAPRDVDPAFIERALQFDARALLVLDNIEQLLPEAAATLSRWRDASPLLRILVTTRAPLGASRERTFELGALDIAGSGGSSDAMELFVTRAREVGASPDAADREAARSIVAELGGVPLALELAAFASGTTDARALLTKITSAPPPARSTDAREYAVARGWGLLDEWARELLCQCSIFHGGFTLEAAARVIELPPSAPRVADALFSLAQKSLLEMMRYDPVRFTMAESVRSHAEEQRRASRSGLVAEWRAAEYYFELAGAVAGLGDALAPTLAETARERENLAALMAFGARMKRPEMVLRAAIALDVASLGSGLSRAELAELDAALARGATDDAAIVGRALGVRASALLGTGSLEDAKRDAMRAHDLADERGDRKQVGAMLVVAGTAAFQAGELEEALDLLERAEIAALERGDRAASVDILYKRGSVHLTLGHADEARDHWERALTLAVQLSDGPGEARVAMGLGSYYLDQGDLSRAREYYDRGERIARALRMHRAHRVVVAYQGVLAFLAGDLERAETQLRRAVLGARQAADPRLEGLDEGLFGAVLATRDRVDEARAAFASSAALVAPHPFSAEVVELLRAHLDLAEARAAIAVADAPTARASYLRAVDRVAVARRADGALSLVERSDDARLTLRVLDREIARLRPTLT